VFMGCTDVASCYSHCMVCLCSCLSLCLSVRPSVCLSVCVSVGHNHSCAETADLMPFGVWTGVGQRNHIFDGGSVTPIGKRQFWGRLPAHCKVCGISGLC